MGSPRGGDTTVQLRRAANACVFLCGEASGHAVRLKRMEAASLVASLISAMATAVLGFLAFRLTRSSNRNAAGRAIGDLANSLARLRVEYPEAIAVARRWQPEDWERLYADRENSRLLLRYYSYVEVGLEFCNTTLRARDARQIRGEAFRGHYGRLTRYFLTENCPIVEQMLQAPYLSTYIRDEVARGRAEGWDWAAEHERLVA